MAKSKKRRKSINPAEASLQKAKRQIAVESNIGKGLVLVKSKIVPAHMPFVVRGLHRDPVLAEVINPNAFPKEYHGIKSTPSWASKDLKRDALWLASSVSIYKDRILNFVFMKEEFEKHILNSDYSVAERKLTEIEESFGKSFWLIENRLLLLDKNEGIDESISFTKSITEDKNNSFFVHMITYFLSIRVEANYSYSRLNNLINDVCADSGVPDLEKAYIKFRVFPFDEIESPDITKVLIKEINVPAIDKYLFLCNFIRVIFSWPKYTAYQTYIIPTLEELSGWIPDRSIQNLICLLGVSNKTLVLHDDVEKVISAFDSYTLGEYKQAYDKFDGLIKEDPSLVELYEGITKTVYYIKEYKKGSSELKYEILNLMHDVFMKSSSFDTSVEKLLKIAVVHSSHSWCIHILSFLRRDGRKQWQEDMHAYTIQSGISSRIFNPWQEKVFSQFKSKNDFWSLLNQSCPQSITLELQDIQSLSVDEFGARIASLGMPIDRVNKYTCFKLLQDKEFEKAIEILEPLVKTGTKDVNYYDALRYLADCYRMAERVKECAELVVNAYLENSYVCSFLPIPALMNLVESEHLDELSSNISWPILNEIYYRHFIDVNEEIRSDSYLDFLEANQVERPSQLDFDKINTNFSVFFLKNVCVLNVMEASIAFASSEDMFQERIKIYQILGQLDPNNSPEYISEIASLNEQIAVRKLSRQVEQSKIYVDVEGIKSKLDKTFEEKYSRYIELSNHPERDAWSANFVDKIMEQILNPQDPKRKFVIPHKETDYVLFNLLSELTDKFISSTDFGLDFYISTRIRHGTLAGQLRGSLDSLHLLTIKDAKGEQYKDNEYWDNRLYMLDSGLKKDLQKVLKDFSKQIDDWIDILKDDWLQIKRVEKDKGLFDYSNSKILYLQVVKKANTKTITYDTFLDLVFDELWVITESNLANIRGKLKSEFEPAIIGLLTSLTDKAAAAIGSHRDNQGFTTAITTAITDFQNSVDRVIEWFQISKSKDTPDTPIKTVLTLGLDSINTYDPKYQLAPEIDISSESDLTIKGEWVSSFTDIFLILFYNVKVHSFIENRSPNMKIKIVKDKDKVRMVFSNELGDSVDIVKIKGKLKSALDFKTITEVVRKEGGSGLPKLHKILKMDMKCNPKFNTRVKNKWLNIEVTLEYGGAFV